MKVEKLMIRGSGREAVVVLGSSAGSLVNFRLPLVKELVRRGTLVYAFAPDFCQQTRDAVRGAGAQPVDFFLQRAGMNPLLDFLSAVELSFKLAKIKPRVVLSYFIKPVIYGTLVAAFVRVPRRVALIEGVGSIFTETDSTTSKRLTRSVMRALVRGLYRVSLIFAHRILFLNNDDRNDFVSSKVIPDWRGVSIGGIGVDLEEWRHKAVVSRGDPIFVMVGRLLIEKGVREFVAASQLVKSRYPSARFVLLGGVDSSRAGIDVSELVEAEQRGLIEWKGHVSVREWLERSTVFVLPSYREGVPRSTQEAMAVGRAVITTDVPGCRETVIDGVNGFLVPARNPEALAEVMSRFLENPQLAYEMGGRSRELAEQRFDVREKNRLLMSAIFGEDGFEGSDVTRLPN